MFGFILSLYIINIAFNVWRWVNFKNRITYADARDCAISGIIGWTAASLLFIADALR